MKARAALAATGVGFGLWGLWLLVDAVEPAALIRLPLWLGGAVVADDFFLVPLTLTAGWLVTRWSLTLPRGSDPAGSSRILFRRGRS